MKKLMLIISMLTLTLSARADTYSTFKTMRYYSDNKLYYLRITANKRAALYRGRHRIWSRILPQLPGKVILTNDGSRIVVIDYYYGNGRNPKATVLRFLNERGADMTTYTLGELADLSKVLNTTSTSHWYTAVELTPDEKYIYVETSIAKYNPTTFKPPLNSNEAIDWMESLPYERLEFSILTGKLTKRTSLVINKGTVARIAYELILRTARA